MSQTGSGLGRDEADQQRVVGISGRLQDMLQDDHAVCGQAITESGQEAWKSGQRGAASGGRDVSRCAGVTALPPA
ncbi:hypothetical protein [Streptomyces sp. AK04-3B]|uniref:hypothetical protein n=1 Tax=Streptomyces sp. AK04-3B TaxID=3028650 RepID=UPI0029ABDF98|nr:hypothetical protein [Streptomyces sp. AK04-3B]MDX3797182.1 hypothetical protein [Streptomyces sp. AK04-3B]